MGFWVYKNLKKAYKTLALILLNRKSSYKYELSIRF